MEELGIGEPGIQRLAALVYAHVGLISFLTAGEDEVRAWTIRRGTSAKGAAGKIHTDLEKHFIRAEIIPYDVFMQTKDLTQARRLGQIKSAGKDEVVQDGDIVTILANA
jgi:ribosome-binding ATPase YchF (GTP1/OBG family)